jgi:hypothetical protein
MSDHIFDHFGPYCNHVHCYAQEGTLSETLACPTTEAEIAEQGRGETNTALLVEIRDLLKILVARESPPPPVGLFERLAAGAERGLQCCSDVPCCERRDQYNRLGSGPMLFACPKKCPCHD